jgi:hypothetical protein
VVTGFPNSGACSWIVSVAPTDEARIKVVAYDAAMNSGEDVSDSDFTIADTTPPLVAVTQPNGGETWYILHWYDITWTAEDFVGVTSVDVLLSTDGGVTYPQTIATGEANDGLYEWMADGPPTDQARVKVIAYDAADNYSYDASDADFTVADNEPPGVEVTSPNGGETWYIDSFFDVTWNADDYVGVTSIDILLSSDGGATYPDTISTGESNDGVYSWQVDVAPTTQARVRVIAYDAAMNSGEDVSDADFTIADGDGPTVTVEAPDGGETWVYGAAENIEWTAYDNIGVSYVDIFLSSDGGATYPDTVATGWTDSVCMWIVSVDPTPTARIRIVAYDDAGNPGSDESDADFEIVDGVDPWVTVTQPNGGETWAIDSFFDVTWTADDDIGVASIDILLSTDGGATYPHTIATGESNDGVYSWQVDVSPTTQARIKVVAYDAAGNDGEDASDADFTIADDDGPTVTVTDPNGGEVWDIGLTYDITWSADDNVGVSSVSLVLSTDGGSTFDDTLAAGEPNDGVYLWLVDVAATTTARIKVIAYDAAGNDGEDASDADFEIYDPVSGVRTDREVPSHLVITGNMPNPFSGRTTVKFGIPRDGWVDMAVYDVSGRLVTRLVDGSYTAGYHSVEWADNGDIGTGLYFLRLRLGQDEVSRKLVISR